ncbi:MAG: hypothetical protein EZS28_007344, partial [Streblomastix strix]
MTSKTLVGGIALHDLHVVDNFIAPKYITIEDPYNDKRVIKDKDKDKQFQTNPIKKGRVDHIVMLEKNYTPLFAACNFLVTLFQVKVFPNFLSQNDGYIEMSVLERKQQVENLKKNIVPKAFIPCNPPKKSVGKGSLYGTIMPPPEHLPEGFKVLTRDQIKQSPRQFQTNPGKQGSFGGGYHTTIMGKEFAYTEDPYGGDPTKKWIGTGAIGKQIVSRPLYTMDHGDRLFDRKNQEFNYEGIKQRSISAPKTTKVVVPFKGMSSIQPTINKFPNYI